VPTWSIYQAMLSTDLPAQGLDFKIPMFFFQGAEDGVTLPALAEDYLARISAPAKAWVLFPDAGHFAVWANPQAFHRELAARVRPFAQPFHASDGKAGRLGG
jgi:pimeloyl-ACP methyl ester carboxylesterase